MSKRRIEHTATALWYRLPLAVVVLIAAYFAVAPSLPEISGKLYPVVERTKLISLERNEEWQTATFTMDKRLSCEYMGMAWYWRDSDGSLHRIPRKAVSPLGADHDLTRLAGLNTFRVTLQTALPPDQWTATVRHRCWVLFDTVSVLWP